MSPALSGEGVVPFSELVADGVSRTVDGAVLVTPTDLRLTPGRAVVLRGVNGSGKTTVLDMVAGATRPSSGTVELDAHPVDERDAGTRRVIAALLHPISGYRDLTVRDHLVLIDQSWGGATDSCDERVEADLQRFDVAALQERFLHELSSGQRQLVDLAMTFARPSGILLLDEPEQRLDADRRALLAQRLIEAKDAGVGIVLACHDDELTDAVADDVVTLHLGTA